MADPARRPSPRTVQKYLRQKGIRQCTLSKESGVSEGTISEWLNKKRTVSAKTHAKIRVWWDDRKPDDYVPPSITPIPPLPPTPTSRRGVVYVLAHEGHALRAKIGRTTDLVRRIRTLSTGNLDLRLETAAYFDDYVAAETAMHRRFASMRIPGPTLEWFSVAPRDAAKQLHALYKAT